MNVFRWTTKKNQWTQNTQNRPRNFSRKKAQMTQKGTEWAGNFLGSPFLHGEFIDLLFSLRHLRLFVAKFIMYWEAVDSDFVTLGSPCYCFGPV